MTCNQIHTSTAHEIWRFIVPLSKILPRAIPATRIPGLPLEVVPSLMRGRRLKAHDLLGEPSVPSHRGRHNYANHTCRDPALGCTRSVASVAVQPWLGLLPQQRFGSHRARSRHSVTDGAYIDPVNLSKMGSPQGSKTVVRQPPVAGFPRGPIALARTGGHVFQDGSLPSNSSSWRLHAR
jgi:hypothetical protein